MNLIKLSWTYLKHKPLNTALNIVLLSLGIAIIVVLLLLSAQLENKLTKNAESIDLVVGAKGSPMQLILSSIFHIDYPTGNIPLNEAHQISKSPFVKKAIPLSLGDSYSTYRIVGTNHSYVDLYHSAIAQGKLWENIYEVTLGAVVAEKLALKVGDSFYGQHGMAQGGHYHEDETYQVVGVLEKSNTVIDNLILTGLESIWGMHNYNSGKDDDEEKEDHGHDTEEDHDHHHEEPHHHEEDRDETEIVKNVVLFEGGNSESENLALLEGKEITSLLIQYASPMALIQMPRMVNSRSSLQAASPAFEMTRLFSLLGVGIEALTAFAYLIIFISCLSIFIALYNALKERKYDLAIMRSMGATRGKLFIHIVLEGVIMTFFGGISGFILAHSAIEIFTMVADAKNEAGFTGFVLLKEEIWIMLMCILLGVVSALIPAINAYRTDISKVLAEG